MAPKPKGGLLLKSQELKNLLEYYPKLIGVAFQFPDVENLDNVNLNVKSVFWNATQTKMVAINESITGKALVYYPTYEAESDNLDECEFEFAQEMKEAITPLNFGFVYKEALEVLVNLGINDVDKEDRRIMVCGMRTNFGTGYSAIELEKEHYTFSLEPYPFPDSFRIPSSHPTSDRDYNLNYGVPQFHIAIPCPPKWREHFANNKSFEMIAEAVNNDTLCTCCCNNIQGKSKKRKEVVSLVETTLTHIDPLQNKTATIQNKSTKKSPFKKKNMPSKDLIEQ